MNIAEQILSYYESEDFRNYYAEILGEDNAGCIDRIKKIVADSYNFKQHFGYNIHIGDETAEAILNWFIDQGPIDTYNSYYVGDACIDSVSFGEQEEQLSGLYNHRTGRPYNAAYLRRVFDEAGYVINDSDRDIAYYNLSDSGVMWRLTDMPEDEFLAILLEHE